MSGSFTAACVQMRADVQIKPSVDQAIALIREAARSGAHYVQTPEMTNILQPERPKFFEAIRSEDQDTSIPLFQAEAMQLGIWLHIGSLAIKIGERQAANRGYVISPDGEVVAAYDKIHMFDVDLPNGQTYRESAAYVPGDVAVMADLPWARLGVTICYDLRFPNLYRTLAEQGAGIMAIPSSFTVPTGEAHWHVLMRARAIENGAFVIAAAQGGQHACGRSTYGHSLIVDPWGKILAEADHDEPAVILAEIDPTRIADTRGRIPSLANGRMFSVADVP
ncbi:carbon-nitrogen hydrolase family protein [Phreatobacter oligotrophus]|uniref:carbon-nitrogen hydrolase family protein n=1 Tax=Phreatobacter oligotrophus TaxID=1122261 RepID=UPI00235279E3|nr:carbon-nitrogen hydrolase family protein [Phreatobacter oligotrophus]MBX9993068.1 carbon-nitrogen hydrolase family protein [Phreatobacter oligotrophus]